MPEATFDQVNLDGAFKTVNEILSPSSVKYVQSHIL